MACFALLAFLLGADAPVFPVPLKPSGINLALKPSALPTPAFLQPGVPAPVPGGPLLPPLVPAAAAPPPAPPAPRRASIMDRLDGGDLEAVRDCVRVLGATPVEADRAAALMALTKNAHWPLYRPAYAALRKTALTERRVDLRQHAVAMLGQARGEHRLAADALRLSALHDSEQSVRDAAFALLEKLAERPAEDVAN